MVPEYPWRARVLSGAKLALCRKAHKSENLSHKQIMTIITGIQLEVVEENLKLTLTKTEVDFRASGACAPSAPVSQVIEIALEDLVAAP